MKYRLRIRPAADADVEDAIRCIARDSVTAALRFSDAIDRSCLQIREHPHRSPRYDLKHPRLAELRKRRVQGLGDYLIFYRIDEHLVEIIRVLHGVRDIPAVLLQGMIDGP